MPQSGAAITSSSDAHHENWRADLQHRFRLSMTPEMELPHGGMLDAHATELVFLLDLIHVTQWHQLNVIINLSPSCFVRATPICPAASATALYRVRRPIPT